MGGGFSLLSYRRRETPPLRDTRFQRPANMDHIEMTSQQIDLFQKPQTQRTTRKLGTPAPVQKIDPAVVAAVANFTWWPTGPGCGGEAGRVMTALAMPVIRSDSNFRPPLSPLRTDCEQAVLATVTIMRLIGASQPGVSFGPAIDKAFANATRFIARQNQPTQKGRKGPAKALKRPS